MAGPMPGEDYASYRARRQAEMSSPEPAAPTGYEKQKAKVAAQHGSWSEGSPKRAVNLDTAATDADELGSTHKRLAGGVKPVIPDREADKNKSEWSKMSEEDQIAAARGTKSAPVSAPKPPAVKSDRKTGITADAATNARNNMGAPRGSVDTSAVSGVTSSDSPDTLAKARAAATKGTRGGNKAAESAAAAKSAKRASTPRSAASASPVTRAPGTPKPRSAFDQKYDVTGRSAAFSYSLGIPQGPSSAMSDRPSTPIATPAPRPATPVSNPAPIAPSPASNASPAAPSAPTTPPGKMDVIGSRPSKGISPGHMVSSAPGRDWLRPQAANKAKKASKPIAAAVEEPVAAPSHMVGESNLGPTAAKKAQAASAAPTAMPAQDTHMASGAGEKVAKSVGSTVGNVNRTPMPSANDYSSVNHVVGQAHGPLSQPQMSRSSAPASAPRSGGRTGAAPRSAEVGGGRVSSGAAGGLHIANEGDSNSFNNIGNVTHVTNVHNYGTMSGNAIGNATGGGRPGSIGGGGGGRPGGGAGGGEHEARAGGFNAWYKDANGMHDLQKGVKHVTGQTGGRGESLTTKSSSGGSQRPLKGSPRASGGVQQPQQTQTPGTGTTNNWQGPQHKNPTSASGNGTANTAPLPKVP